MRGELYQIVLITLGIVTAALFSTFVYKELNPEYRIYQEDYIELEKFRASYTGAAVPSFKTGVKQIVIERKDKGPAEIDRCTSCHVALKFEHFSPTKIAYDINGNMITGADGLPKKIKNENYVWGKLEDKITLLRDQDTNNQLLTEGKSSVVKANLAEADRLESLKTAHVGEHTYDVTKVLAMHPLIGRETRPFELHPMEEYSCTSCHSGNGRGLTTEKAHGPVFDGQYEEEFMGPTPKFLEKDNKNDPQFARIFNHKPSHSLLFQTTPILIGSLMESKCVQCHTPTRATLQNAYQIANIPTAQKRAKSDAVIQAYNIEVAALVSLLELKKKIDEKGYEKTIASLSKEEQDYSFPEEKREAIAHQIRYLRRFRKTPQKGIDSLNHQIYAMIGQKDLVNSLEAETKSSNEPLQSIIDQFISKNRTKKSATGSLFAKKDAADLEKALLHHVKDTESSFKKTVADQRAISAMVTDVDLLTQNFQKGQNLFFSQACYACHRISGLSRGGVGPELTEEGEKYPWFIKESMVWPQADLKTSTMPNFHLDHEELESLMTFLLAQKGQKKSDSDTGYKLAIQEWEGGKKMEWEEPISPAKMHDLNYSMEVFATEGCAACHRLKGYESNIGFAIEKEKDVDFNSLYKESEWFQKLFPEQIPGSQIVHVIENNQDEIDRRIVDNVRSGAILEKIEANYPDAIESLYSNFKFALRAKNHTEKKEEWQERVRRVLMVYIQEYGLGRLIGPKPNWAGVYRSDEWLMEHFKNPSSHVARSIMPVLPFDNTKFYSLTYMLDILGIRNRDALRKEWQERGFNPKQAYDVLCAQCHGEFLQGNGPVSEWIYPIPKSLRNADFLRNLTREKAYESIVHGVKGTPMPPWGEVGADKPMADGKPVLTRGEITQIVDWIYSSLPGGTVIRGAEDIPKWRYQPDDIIKELKKEGGQLESQPSKKKIEKEEKEALAPELTALQKGSDYYADLNPKVYTNKKEVSDYFNIVPHPVGDTEEKGYYIKKKYYTPGNLAAGQAYFELNCAACHGRDADGAGLRAGAMVDAKPRMLTNLGWLDTRDDLRLIRSIKYGVSGTSMTAWGDQTSSLQRMQLVMYIRTLSQEAKYRDQLLDTLYKTFNESELVVEKKRIQEIDQLTALQNSLEETEENKNRLQRGVPQGENSKEEALKAYQKQLELTQKLHQLEAEDALLQQLIAEIKKERRIMQELGLRLISQATDASLIDNYYNLIQLQSGLYSLKNGELTFSKAKELEITKAGQTILSELEKDITALQKEKVFEQGKIRSPQGKEQITLLINQINSLNGLKNKTISVIEEGKRSRTKQQELVDKYNNLTM